MMRDKTQLTKHMMRWECSEMRRVHRAYILGENDMLTSTTGFLLIRVGIALFLGLFMVGVNLFLTSRDRKETTEKHYHHLSDRVNPALSS